MIGGGPAGAAAAIALQGHGCRTIVLEAARFPRHHVGESLVSLWPVFDQLGVSDEMDATFQHKRGSCRIWGHERELQWTALDSLAGGRQYSLQVVGRLLGFSSPSSFTRWFSAEFGMAPREWRKTAGNTNDAG